jgi:hypothetical protein
MIKHELQARANGAPATQALTLQVTSQTILHRKSILTTFTIINILLTGCLTPNS